MIKFIKSTFYSKRQRNFFKMAKAIYSRPDLYFPIHNTHLDTVSNLAVPLICHFKEICDRLVATCDEKVEIWPIVGGDMTEQPFFISMVIYFLRVTPLPMPAWSMNGVSISETTPNLPHGR